MAAKKNKGNVYISGAQEATFRGIFFSEEGRPKVVGGLHVPEFQRVYSYNPANTAPLINSICQAFQRNPDAPCFLGQLVIARHTNVGIDGNILPASTGSGGVHDLIDGQQRMITLNILLATLREGIQDRKLKQEITQWLTMDGRGRLDLGTHNKVNYGTAFYENMQAEDGSQNLANAPKDGKTPQMRFVSRLEANFECIEGRLAALLTPEQLEDFARFVWTRCRFTVITAVNEPAAFRLFAILNLPGLALQGHEIIRATVLEDVAADASLRQGFRGAFGGVRNDMMDTFYTDQARVQLAKADMQDSFRQSFDSGLTDPSSPQYNWYMQVNADSSKSTLVKHEAVIKMITNFTAMSLAWTRIVKLSNLTVAQSDAQGIRPVADAAHAIMSSLPGQVDYQMPFEEEDPNMAQKLLNSRTSIFRAWSTLFFAASISAITLSTDTRPNKIKVPLLIDPLIIAVERYISMRLICYRQRTLVVRTQIIDEIYMKTRSILTAETLETVHAALHPDANMITKVRERLAGSALYSTGMAYIAKYVLARIERKWTTPGVDLDSKLLLKAQVEHIYPQRPISKDAAMTKLCHSLGNLALITPEMNLRISNMDWKERKEEYKGALGTGKSAPFQTLHHLLSTNVTWNLTALNERQNAMLTALTDCWNLQIVSDGGGKKPRLDTSISDDEEEDEHIAEERATSMMLPYCERLKISELKDLGIKTARLAEMKRKFCETYQTLDQLKILQLRVLCKKWKAPLPATKPLLIAGLRGIMAQHMQKTKATASDDIDQIDDSAAEIEQPDEEEGEEESEKEDGKEIIKNENENMGEVNKKGKMPLADDMPKDRSDSQKKKDKKPNKKPQAKPDSAKNGEQSSTSKATPSGSKVASSGPGDNPAPSSTSTIQKCPVKCTYSGDIEARKPSGRFWVCNRDAPCGGCHHISHYDDDRADSRCIEKTTDGDLFCEDHAKWHSDTRK